MNFETLRDARLTEGQNKDLINFVSEYYDLKLGSLLGGPLPPKPKKWELSDLKVSPVTEDQLTDEENEKIVTLVRRIFPGLVLESPPGGFREVQLDVPSAPKKLGIVKGKEVRSYTVTERECNLCFLSACCVFGNAWERFSTLCTLTFSEHGCPKHWGTWIHRPHGDDDETTAVIW